MLSYTFPKRIMEYLEQRKARNSTAEQETMFLREMRRRYDMEQFKLINTIGKGAFSLVYLAVDKITNEYVAIKAISKSSEKTVTAALQERNALVELIRSQFLVKTKACFEDDKYFYIIMEYCAGGDLMGLLMRQNILSEEEAKFYLAEMLEAIDDVHLSGYIYRDAKPDNVLINSDGHIKLADFNLAINAEEKDKMTAGTLDYTAPEVFDKVYSESADIFSVGCIFYECVVGRPPFASQNSKETIQKIKNCDLQLNKLKLSDVCKDLLSKMICFESQRWSFEQLKGHDFFKGIDFNELLEIEPPFVPRLAGFDDTRYFDMAGVDYIEEKWWGTKGVKKTEYTYKAFPDTITQAGAPQRKKLNELFEETSK